MAATSTLLRSLIRRGDVASSSLFARRGLACNPWTSLAALASDKKVFKTCSTSPLDSLRKWTYSLLDPEHRSLWVGNPPSREVLERMLTNYERSAQGQFDVDGFRAIKNVRSLDVENPPFFPLETYHDLGGCYIGGHDAQWKEDTAF